jgi:hypothetical protein
METNKVTDEMILIEYMEERDCEWGHQELRDKIRESNGFQLHLASTRFNEGFRILWDSIPWWRKVLIRISGWVNEI